MLEFPNRDSQATSNKALLSANQVAQYSLYQSNKTTNNPRSEQFALRIKGSIAACKFSLYQLVKRHLVLRLRLFETNNELWQKEKSSDSIPIEVINTNQNITTKQLILNEQKKFINSLNTPLATGLIIEEKDDNYVVVLTVNHIIIDAYSMNILINDFVKLYNALKVGDKVNLPVISNTFFDYLTFQRSISSNYDYQQGLDFWLNYLDQHEESLLIKNNYCDKTTTSKPVSYYHNLTEDNIQKIDSVAKHYGVTRFVFITAVITIMINRLSSQTDITFGSITPNRDQGEFNQTVGLLASTLVYRFKVNINRQFNEFLKIVHRQVLDAQRHGFVDFMDIAKLFSEDKNNHLNPIFQVMINEISYPYDSNFDFILKPQYAYTQFPLLIQFITKNNNFGIEYIFEESLNESGIISDLIDSLPLFIDEILNNNKRQLKDYVILTIQDKQLMNLSSNNNKHLSKNDINIINSANNAEQFLPNETLISYYITYINQNNLLDNIAIIDNQNTSKYYSYRTLEHDSNLLAKYLIYSNYNNNIIGICCEKGYQQVVGLLGIMQSGSAYLPLSLDWPINRTKKILLASDVNTILISRNIYSKYSKSLTDTTCVILEDIYQLFVNSGSKQNIKNIPLPKISVDDVAYVIYTSGSTGDPKGVTISHKNALNTILAVNKRFNINENDKILAISDLSFDLSVYDIFGMLCCGGCIVFPQQSKIKDQTYLLQIITKNHITIWDSAPLMLSVFLNNTDNLLTSSTLKLFLLSGDYIAIDLVKQIRTIYPQASIVSLGGATEGSIWSIWHEIDDINFIKVPYGKAMPNQKMYVLDQDLKHCPVGIPGEIYIGGVGVALNYHKNDKKTSEHFINHISLGRVYKTGDIGCWHTDGYMEFIGRLDNHVKLYGYRIELSEIESILTRYPNINQCVTLIKRYGDKEKIVAYYKSPKKIDYKSLIEHVKSNLPAYMIPSEFIHVQEFPVTINGKLDKNALLNLQHIETTHYVNPRNEIESLFVSTWKKLLGISKLGIEDDFFGLGGDSILSIQLISRLRQHGFDFSVEDVFTYRTIKKLVNSLTSECRNYFTKQCEQGILKGEFDLLPIQQWFFSQNFINPHHWNQSFLVRVPDLSFDNLENTLSKLIEHHDILRVKFVKNANGVIKQEYQDTINTMPIMKLNVSKLSTQDIAATLTEWQSNFNIYNGPLWQFGYMHHYNDGSARLFFAFHHLIIDTVSWQILLDDFKSLYHGKSLSKKTNSYRQWVNVVKTYSLKSQAQVSYWQEQLKHCPEYDKFASSDIPVCKSLNIDKSITEQLLSSANKAFYTETIDLLLTALAYTLNIWIPDLEHTITFEGHGREEINTELDLYNTVGWFTTMYPVRLDIQENIEKSIKLIKEYLRNIPQKGLSYGALKYKNNTELSTVNLPSIRFNYLGNHSGSANEWQIINEYAGKTMSSANKEPNIIDITACIISGEMQFRFETYLADQECVFLINAFQEQLRNVVDFCTKRVCSNYLTKTPSDFSYPMIKLKTLESLQEKYVIEDIFPATSLQQGFIYHALSSPNDDAYRIQFLLDYHLELDINSYKKSWKLAILKYPILRTLFNWDEELIQAITKYPKLNWKFTDIEHFQNKDSKIKEIQKNDRLVTFNLQNPSLLRLNLIKQRSSQFTLLITIHHSIIDGWSTPILLDFVHNSYQRLLQGEKIIVNEDRAYLEAQRHIINHRKKSKLYWNKILKDIDGANDINLFLDKKTNLDKYRLVNKPMNVFIDLKENEYADLIKLKQSYNLTLHSIIQFAWHKLIQIYTQDTSTIVGTTVSGRAIPVAGIDESVGLFINTLPLVLTWQDRSVLEQLKFIEKQSTGMNEHADIELVTLQKDGQRLFHSLLVFENYPDIDKDSSSVTVELRDAIEKMDYPLGLIIHNISNKLSFKLCFDGNLLKTKTAKHLMNNFKRILKELVTKLEDTHTNINIISQDEKYKLLHTWNKTYKPFSSNKTIHELFTEQAHRTPDKIALIFDSKSLTYKELNERSNQLAHYLRMIYQESYQKPFQVNSLIAIYLDHSFEAIIGILGVLKAGGAYVPISTDYPIERTIKQLYDTKPKFLLTKHNVYQNDLCNNQVIFLDDYLERDQSKFDLKPISSPKDLVYVIYTSGTTGKPKGVMIEHQGLINTIEWMQSAYQLKPSDVVLQKTPYVFDVSCWEFIWPHWVGATVAIVKPGGHKDPEYLLNYMQKTGVTVTHFVPSALSSFLRYVDLSKNRVPNSLRHILSIGEPLSNLLVKSLYKLAGNYCKLHNLYGPTEASIHVTSYVCQQNFKPILIGRPINNIKLYILDPALNLVPTGVVGELYIGGIGLGRGYLYEPELTDEKFIDNPFLNPKDRSLGYFKLYKTGDLVRYLDDGNIEFIGRNDFQVKIRGHRIELSEIESELLNIPTINQAVVVADKSIDSASTQLIAYYVSTKRLSSSELRYKLSQHLPDYMLPLTFIRIPNIPLTINGKLDRTSLPSPEITINAENYIAPRNSREIKIAKIWQEELNVKTIGIHDDFFKLGGDSIKSINLVSRIRQLGFECSVREIFELRTIEKLVKRLNSKAIYSFGNKSIKYSPYEIINSDSQQLPIFVFPPSEGGAECYYNNLAKGLSDEKLILFNNYYNEIIKQSGEKAIEHTSYKDLSAYYLNHVKSLNPTDPFILLGWSMGGTIALDLTYELIKSGYKVPVVVIIDSFFSVYKVVDILAEDNSLFLTEHMMNKNINYNHRPEKMDLADTKVILFKAKKEIDCDTKNEALVQLSKYYVNHTNDNYLGDVCSANIEIIKIDASHNTWVKQDLIIKMICKKIKELIYS